MSCPAGAGRLHRARCGMLLDFGWLWHGIVLMPAHLLRFCLPAKRLSDLEEGLG